MDLEADRAHLDELKRKLAFVEQVQRNVNKTLRNIRSMRMSLDDTARRARRSSAADRDNSATLQFARGFA